MPHPVSVYGDRLVKEWLQQVPSSEVRPTVNHTAVLAELLREAGRAGNLVNDAHLAALALSAARRWSALIPASPGFRGLVGASG
jgi:predicted nucleic acid-binding protein